MPKKQATLMDMATDKREKKVRAICDYIFSGEAIKWRNFVPIDVDFDTDHRLLVAKLE